MRSRWERKLLLILRVTGSTTTKCRRSRELFCGFSVPGRSGILFNPAGALPDSTRREDRSSSASGSIVIAPCVSRGQDGDHGVRVLRDSSLGILRVHSGRVQVAHATAGVGKETTRLLEVIGSGASENLADFTATEEGAAVTGFAGSSSAHETA